ncbi:MAG: hypothetical protein M3321_00155 [Actinomycetota bacterium]|nr:hypothetical protein [Actinomycetota bacterium]
MATTIPDGNNIAALADWAELYLASTPATGLSAVTADRFIRGSGEAAAEIELEVSVTDDADEELDVDDAAGVEVALAGEAQDERDARVELLFEEVGLRLEIGPRVYPFATEDDQIVERDAAGREIYLLLLVLSTEEASFRSDRRAHEVEAIYDEVALVAVRRFLGPKSAGVRFARNSHDPDDPDTRPALFSEAIEWLRDRLDLRRGVRPATSDDEEPRRHWEFVEPRDDGRAPLNSYKDAGVDVVAWRFFADARRGFPVLLAQCTVQLDWENKVGDVKVDLWMKWIDFDTVPPQKALVIPFAVNRADRLWDDRTVSAGVIIDRLRLLELLDEAGVAALRRLAARIPMEWVRSELESLGLEGAA